MKKITFAILFLFTMVLGYSQDTLTIELLTDYYTNETAWGVFDSSGTLITQNATLSPNTLVVTDIPASPSECYHFVIIDAYGDGIAGDSTHPGPGYLTIKYNGTQVGGFTTANANFGSRLDIWGLGDGCANVDAKMVRINTLPFTEVGNTDVVCRVQNIGLNNLTSFDINYQIDNTGTIVTQNVSGINMAIGDSNTYTFTTPWYAPAIGFYNLRVWVSNINGVGDDENISNDSKDINISVPSQSVTNVPLFELFTSSSCGPCAGFNGNIFNPFMAQHNDIAVVKYQSNGPGVGDPYYTAEVGVRASYYRQSGVPQLYIGATDYAEPGYVPTSDNVNEGYNNEIAKNAYVELNAIHAIRLEDNSVDVEIDIDPHLSGEFKVHAVVVENTTTGNTGSNGETSFERVMMKMVPDANGTTVNFVDGQHLKLNLSASLAGTHIEEMNDLSVVVFIQHNDSKVIMQSANSVEDNTASVNNYTFDTVSLYPNPSTGIFNVKTDRTLQISITDLLGRKVYANNNIINNNTIDLSNLSKGVYMVNISDGAHTGTQKIVLK